MAVIAYRRVHTTWVTRRSVSTVTVHGASSDPATLAALQHHLLFTLRINEVADFDPEETGRDGILIIR